MEEMRVIHHLDDLPRLSGSVVTIGNFDGFHLGHRAIIRALGERGAAMHLPVVAMTFKPHPLVEVAPERAPVPLSTPAERIRLLEEAGVDIVFVQHFDEAFSRLTPEVFIGRYLVDAFHARLVAVGQNFRFGHQHRGTLQALESAADDFEVLAVPPVLFRGHAVSSSRIRREVAAGNVSTARRMLGRCYTIEGRVVRGEGRGGRETVPTLNLDPSNRLIPRSGVYLTRARIPGFPNVRSWVDSLTNVGLRPTFGGDSLTIETFVLDHVLGVRPPTLELKFLAQLRDEKIFSGADALKAQILKDAGQARRFFRRLDRRTSRECVGASNPNDDQAIH